MAGNRTPDSEVRELTDAKTLSALANPHRSRIIDILAVHGPATASAIAHRMEVAVGSVSHHLKVLAEVELVEEAPELAKDRRERWWRLASRSTRWSRSDFTEDAAATSAALAAESMALQKQIDRARDWLAASSLTDAWDVAAFATQTWVRLSPDELSDLAEELISVVRCWRERTDQADDGVERRPVFFFARGFPSEP
ncbi:MAG TPA: helix-turn-helix domain-containing protein [Jatrophihabitans sp.]|nr:helix-turn-helix domain-containing protein [Jatrophihabitans sp.]